MQLIKHECDKAYVEFISNLMFMKNDLKLKE